MKRPLILMLLILVTVALLYVADTGANSVTAHAPHAYSSNAGRHVMTAPHKNLPSPRDQAAAAAKVTQAVQTVLPDARVGFEVFDQQKGTVLSSQDAGRQFASMSVVKLLIALDALGSNNWAIPDEPTRQQLHRMLAASDDAIASNLWAANGGPAIVTRMVGLLGLASTQPPDNPGMWGDTLITPRDMVTVYRYITDKLPDATRDLLIGALTDAPQTAADGFDQYFGIPAGMPHTTWAIKQGWGTSGSQAVMHSTGLAGADLRYVVVMSVSAPANSYSAVPAAVTAGTSALRGVICPTSS